MKNEFTLTNEKKCRALIDQLADAFAGFYDPPASGAAPFSARIDSLCRNRIDRWIEAQDGYVLQTVLTGLLHQLTGKNESPDTLSYGEKRLRKVTEYVHLHYRDEIRLQSLALHIGMTEPAFCRFFKKAAGEPFTAYVNKIRIEHAAEQLLNDGDSVSGIGYACGFNTIDYFIRIFKKLKGCTPGEYRKMFTEKTNHKIP